MHRIVSSLSFQMSYLEHKSSRYLDTPKQVMGSYGFAGTVLFTLFLLPLRFILPPLLPFFLTRLTVGVGEENPNEPYPAVLPAAAMASRGPTRPHQERGLWEADRPPMRRDSGSPAWAEPAVRLTGAASPWPRQPTRASSRCCCRMERAKDEKELAGLAALAPPAEVALREAI